MSMLPWHYLVDFYLHLFFTIFNGSCFWNYIDRIGRRPILLFSIFGIALSYLIWFFSEFLPITVSRLVSGLMGSNITTATAAVADTTSEKLAQRVWLLLELLLVLVLF